MRRFLRLIKRLIKPFLILGVVGVAVYIALPSSTNLFGRDISLRQGLDLQGGVRLVYELDLSQTGGEDKQDAIESTRNVIERRINITGAVEPLIQSSKIGETSSLIVELPGVGDVQEAIDLIGATAQLEFRELDSVTQSWIPTGLSGKQLDRATVSFEPTTNQPQVALKFNDEGRQLFADITARNISQPLAIFLDEQVLSAPTVQQQITAGEAVITGDFTLSEVKELVSLLNAGALDVPIKLVEQRTIGASLGEESVKKSLAAGSIGLILIAVFMLVNYRLAGLAAVLALLGYSAVTIAIFKLVPVTLTLSGIAAFIISIGMAVDANVLIFERMREELRRGESVRKSLELGFSRSWPSVRDSNAASVITAIILYYTTTGLTRGFAFVLAIGVLVSLFSSITLSRLLLRSLLNKFTINLLAKV